MNRKLEAHLKTKYPEILKDMHGDPKVTCMAWGCECGNGWFFLIDGLLDSIQSHIDLHKEIMGEEVEQVVALQIKEKFGELQFYCKADDRIKGMINLATYLSRRICEECGVMTELVNKNSTGYIQSTCPACAKQSKEDEHWENRNKELAQLWDEVREEERTSVERKLRKLMDEKDGQ